MIVTEYRVYRAEVNANGTLVQFGSDPYYVWRFVYAWTDGTSETFTDTGVTAGKKYAYRITRVVTDTDANTSNESTGILKDVKFRRTLNSDGTVTMGFTTSWGDTFTAGDEVYTFEPAGVGEEDRWEVVTGGQDPTLFEHLSYTGVIPTQLTAPVVAGIAHGGDRQGYHPPGTDDYWEFPTGWESWESEKGENYPEWVYDKLFVVRGDRKESTGRIRVLSTATATNTFDIGVTTFTAVAAGAGPAADEFEVNSDELTLSGQAEYDYVARGIGTAIERTLGGTYDVQVVRSTVIITAKLAGSDADAVIDIGVLGWLTKVDIGGGSLKTSDDTDLVTYGEGSGQGFCRPSTSYLLERDKEPTPNKGHIHLRVKYGGTRSDIDKAAVFVNGRHWGQISAQDEIVDVVVATRPFVEILCGDESYYTIFIRTYSADGGFADSNVIIKRMPRRGPRLQLDRLRMTPDKVGLGAAYQDTGGAGAVFTLEDDVKFFFRGLKEHRPYQLHVQYSETYLGGNDDDMVEDYYYATDDASKSVSKLHKDMTYAPDLTIDLTAATTLNLDLPEYSPDRRTIVIKRSVRVPATTLAKATDGTLTVRAWFSDLWGLDTNGKIFMVEDTYYPGNTNMPSPWIVMPNETDLTACLIVQGNTRSDSGVQSLDVEGTMSVGFQWNDQSLLFPGRHAEDQKEDFPYDNVPIAANRIAGYSVDAIRMVNTGETTITGEVKSDAALPNALPESPGMNLLNSGNIIAYSFKHSGRYDLDISSVPNGHWKVYCPTHPGHQLLFQMDTGGTMSTVLSTEGEGEAFIHNSKVMKDPSLAGAVIRMTRLHMREMVSRGKNSGGFYFVISDFYSSQPDANSWLIDGGYNIMDLDTYAAPYAEVTDPQHPMRSIVRQQTGIVFSKLVTDAATCIKTGNDLTFTADPNFALPLNGGYAFVSRHYDGMYVDTQRLTVGRFDMGIGGPVITPGLPVTGWIISGNDTVKLHLPDGVALYDPTFAADQTNFTHIAVKARGYGKCELVYGANRELISSIGTTVVDISQWAVAIDTDDIYFEISPMSAFGIESITPTYSLAEEVWVMAQILGVATDKITGTFGWLEETLDANFQKVYDLTGVTPGDYEFLTYILRPTDVAYGTFLPVGVDRKHVKQTVDGFSGVKRFTITVP